MEFQEWEPLYQQILTDFGYDRSKDEHSAEVLSKLLATRDKIQISTLQNLIHGQPVYVFGAGPSLENDVQVDDFKNEYNGIIIAADGATSALVNCDIIPDIIVTDLDGKIEDQIHANEQGALVFIHAHGDNLPALEKWAPQFPKKVIGTTQSKPFGNIRNYGGFTDGDRAVFMAAHFKADKIFLVAFDFEEPGEYSFQSDFEIKVKKLTWALGLIGMIVSPEVVFHH
ncbi:MAG: DUF115 domain-containing protein [Thermoplasmata archaeon]|nr:DUF115 domain-containing protein [Thermoplasmata archaeon]